METSVCVGLAPTMDTNRVTSVSMSQHDPKGGGQVLTLVTRLLFVCSKNF